MTLDPLAGHVVVLAGSAAVAGADLMSAGALVAVVTEDRAVIADLEQKAALHPTTMLLSYCADPADASVWERVAAHIEQRVGPVDAVLCPPEISAVLEATFASDMGRRGHGAIVSLSPETEPVEHLRRHLRRTR